MIGACRMTNREIGASIFEKWYASAFINKHTVRFWLAEAKKQAASEIDNGFYQAEAKAFVLNPKKLMEKK